MEEVDMSPEWQAGVITCGGQLGSTVPYGNFQSSGGNHRGYGEVNEGGFCGGVLEGGRRIPWVAWEQVCKGSVIGGLGLGFLAWQNKALMLNWGWRFGVEQQALWRQVLCQKHPSTAAAHLLPLLRQRAPPPSPPVARASFFSSGRAPPTSPPVACPSCTLAEPLHVYRKKLQKWTQPNVKRMETKMVPPSFHAIPKSLLKLKSSSHCWKLSTQEQRFTAEAHRCRCRRRTA
ncbi:uncharacterized protein LOC130730540 [Lotus japonicus]|uniref:uncharacterized protein LOC130730540 n=1 Tax=Lotus japonicus TaxID=34305 RepID=UPI00258DB146|nr:uncharacterized protein LOC130730540 [Lotus japonicus]